MKRSFLFFVFMLSLPALSADPEIQDGREIRLIVRADDIGSSHAANVACIQSYQEGIVRSVELMVPCPWFTEAVRMLNENPGLDVGVHLTLTSEWENMKWRPVSCAPSLVDSNGFFFPMVWQNPNFPPNTSIQKSQWKLGEVEKEMRVQIETALRHVPRVSHMGFHMGVSGLDSSIAALEKRLAKEYGLDFEWRAAGLKGFPGWKDARAPEDRIRQFVRNLEALEPGTYVFVEHPGLNEPEMKALGHKGYEDVAADRDAVTRVFTSEDVKAAIQKRGIRLVSFKDVREGR